MQCHDALDSIDVEVGGADPLGRHERNLGFHRHPCIRGFYRQRDTGRKHQDQHGGTYEP